MSIRFRVEDTGLVEVLLSSHVAPLGGMNDSFHHPVHPPVEICFPLGAHSGHPARYLGLENAPLRRSDVSRSFLLLHQHCDYLVPGNVQVKHILLFFLRCALDTIIRGRG